jgi:hypothetical protein
MRTARRTFWVALLVGFVSISACDEDPVVCDDCVPGHDDPPTPTRVSVLNNLEIAYNRRDIDKYIELLDEDFAMFFSSGDVRDGRTPEQWGRADEVAANTNLFNDEYVDQDPSDGIQPRCTKITLDVKWEDGVLWQEIEPASAPGEKWYTATIFYNYQFDVEPDLHLINHSGSKAQFTVRNAGTDAELHWQLVEMRDLDGEVAASTSSRGTARTTWGQVKALYRP